MMSLVYLFKEEIEQIQDDKIRGFVVDALDKVPEFYHNLQTFINETEKSFNYANAFLNVLGCSDYVCDVVRSAILLQDITRYKEVNDGQDEWSIEEDLLHPLNVRITLSPLLGVVGQDKFDDIMRTIESSHGLSSPIPQVTPSLQDPIYIWILPFSNHLARAY